jgi:hypothetical protein
MWKHFLADFRTPSAFRVGNFFGRIESPQTLTGQVEATPGVEPSRYSVRVVIACPNSECKAEHECDFEDTVFPGRIKCDACGERITLRPIESVSVFPTFLDSSQQARPSIIQNLRLDPDKRVAIPAKVKRAAWVRDQGKCCRCGSRDRLEYDHIIPVTKGGSNTERNVELLCEDCNRSKGASI